MFAVSALAIVPLAGLMGDATEALAEYLGPTLGALLNATLGNAPEIIISLFALNRGLIGIVKSSLTGSIIGNLLFGLGLSMFAGGLKVKTQKFDSRVARINGALSGTRVVRTDHPGDLPDEPRRSRRRAGSFARDFGDLVPGLPGEPGIHAGDRQTGLGQSRACRPRK